MKNLTKEQQQELQKLATEMEAEAIQMKLDYEENPSTESGSLIYIHENAEFLEENEVSHSLDEEE